MPSGTEIANPKSMTLMLCWESSKIFSSFISRWMMFWLWQWSIAITIYRNLALASSSYNYRFGNDFKYALIDNEPGYSITKLIVSAVLTVINKEIMLGWHIRCKIYISRFTLLRFCRSVRLLFSYDLIATYLMYKTPSLPSCIPISGQAYYGIATFSNNISNSKLF